MLRRMLLTLLLVSLAGHVAAARSETWIALSEGHVRIAADGSVAEVRFERPFGSGIDAALERQISAWRFEPIVREGRAVEAIARMSLRLLAEFDGSRDGKVRVSEVRFVDPPGKGEFAEHRAAWSAPRYPDRAASGGHGALLTMLAEVDESGRVVHAAGVSAWLTGPKVSDRLRKRIMQRFVDASREAIMGWQMPRPAETGRRFYSFPIYFAIPNRDSPWRLAHWMALAPEPWMQGVDRSTTAELDARGRPARSDLRLLTELDPAQGPSG